MTHFPASRLIPLFLAVALVSVALARGQDDLVFGSRDKASSGLIAIIYDLKQHQDREPSNVSANEYPDVIKEFLEKNWDENVLNRFFRVTQPLYSTQIFIPRISANAAPKAYGIEDIVRPSNWVIHYKGQVSPPEDGAYRFAGYADDVLVVGVNDRTVCIGARPDMRMESVWESGAEESGAPAHNGRLVYGDWIPMRKDEPIDLDVLVGERPGGDFSAFLLFQKKGVAYPRDRAGKLILPVFQLADRPIPDSDRRLAPPFSKPDQMWKQHP